MHECICKCLWLGVLSASAGEEGGRGHLVCPRRLEPILSSPIVVYKSVPQCYKGRNPDLKAKCVTQDPIAVSRRGKIQTQPCLTIHILSTISGWIKVPRSTLPLLKIF